MNILLSTNRMHGSIKSQHSPVHHLAILTFFVFLSIMDAPALSTGVLLQFTIDPATVRKREKDETPLVATVILKVPSPSFFVCQIRSSDKDKITFADIVFKKGQIKATGQGIVYWPRVLKDSQVQVSAFSVDAPGEKLGVTVALKTKSQNQYTSYSRRDIKVGGILLVFVFGFIISQRLCAQSLEPFARLQQEATASSVPAISPAKKLSQEAKTLSAVEYVSGNSFWLADLFEKGSPLHFGVIAGETYDDNIFISQQKTADFLTHISPSLDFEKGDRTAANANYLNVFFAPTLFLYANHPKQNREDYDTDLYYQHQWTRLTLGLEEHYQKLTGASIDIGKLAKRTINTTVFNSSYDYNDRLKLSGTATQRITSYQSGSNVGTNEWIVDGYALYQVAPKLAIGVGPRIAFIDIMGAPNQTHQDLLLHLTYNPEGKISMTFAGGLEYLQYQDNTPSHILPIFDFTANYNPRDGTSVSFSCSRQSISSYNIAGENYLNTVAQVGCRQRFIHNIYFTLSAGYTVADYEFGSQPLSGPKRNDNYYFANAGVEWVPKDWLKASVHFQHAEDKSTFAQNSFNDNQVDFQTSLWF